MAATVKFTSVKKHPGIRRNSRSGMFEALATRFLGSFDTLDKAVAARKRFIAAADMLLAPKNGLSARERKHDEQEARNIVAGHLAKKAPAARSESRV